MKTSHESLEERLKALYIQKQKICDEIAQIQQALNHSKLEQHFSKDEKIALFKELFVGSFDIYAKKWHNKQQQKTYYFPVTQTFKAQDYLPFSNEAIEQHLRGHVQLATYPIINASWCKYLVLQINHHDIAKFHKALSQLHLKALYERTTTQDIKIWILFDALLLASHAIDLANTILQYAKAHAKIFPNQNFSNKSQLEAPVPLPFYLKSRQEHKTVFIDIQRNEVIANQWAYLSHIEKNSLQKINVILDSHRLNQAQQVLDVPVFRLEIILKESIYISTLHLSNNFLKALKAMASFENPQIKVLQKLRKPLYNTPRVIHSYEEEGEFLKLPRGLFNTILSFFEQHKIEYNIQDQRFFKPFKTKAITFNLREEQQDAIACLQKYDSAICVAPPGFGKTLIGAKMIEQRQACTLVIVNKNMLLNQWIERFVDYFNIAKKEVGYLGKGNNRLNGQLDVATMQSLKNQPEVVLNYALVIVDECHHIPAVTFEQIIKNFSGKYILGLSATPKRKDGLEPILYQQLGQVAYEFKKAKTRVNEVKIVHTQFECSLDNYANIITQLCNNKQRNELIVDEIIRNQERSILVLTDRLEHISELEKILEQKQIQFLSVHGALNKKEQVEKMQEVAQAKLILATTSFFGEGIDFPHLNTILFATPISYYGRLIQYLGRIGRNNQTCLAIDFLDSKNAMLNSAFFKRKEGYAQMHYKILQRR
jgi:superfamily II DNA or RNA helicase